MKMDERGWKWIKMDEIDKVDTNGRKWMKIEETEWKIDENGWK